MLYGILSLNTKNIHSSFNNIYSIVHSAKNINGLWNNSFDTYRLYKRKGWYTIMSDIIKSIGQRIRNYRTQLGLSQEKLAELSGCHPTYIGQVERGEKNATIESIEKIAVALNVSLSALFEKLGGNNSSENDLPLKCYELLASKSREEQEQIYQILLQLDKYKHK